MFDPIRPFLTRQGTLILDGGLATELETRGADLADDLWSARLLADDPELIYRVHRAYLRAGADCVVSASYQATFEGFARRGLDAAATERLLRRSVDLAVRARDEMWEGDEAWKGGEVRKEVGPEGGRLRPLVAASVGPYGAYLADGSEYRGDYGLSARQLSTFHGPRFGVLSSAGCDLLAIETIPSRDEALVLVDLLEATSGPPAWMSFTCRDERALWDGTEIEALVAEVEACPRLLSVGVNCTAPEHVGALLRRAAESTDKPLVAYPNSGEGWDAAAKRWLAGAHTAPLHRRAVEWSAAGAGLIGGCCRTTPADIRALRRELLGS